MLDREGNFTITCSKCNLIQERTLLSRALNVAWHHHQISGRGHNCEVTEKTNDSNTTRN